jgi:hypothetical protein
MVKENVIVAQTHLDAYIDKTNDAKLLNRIKYVNCKHFTLIFYI